MSIFSRINQFLKRDPSAKKKESRRTVQNRNRGANKWGLKPFVPALDLDTIANINRLRDHVQNVLEERPDWREPIIEAPVGAPGNGYDYRRDVLPGFEERSTKPKGSNAWPHNKALACCGKSEKHCTCGEWRRYF